MTKKDFEFLATYFAASRPNGVGANPDRLAQWMHMTWSMAINLQAKYPRFNRDRFLEWCDYPVPTENPLTFS